MTATDPLLVFYGDDFTGSTDLVLQYRRFGLEGVIFLGLPTSDQLSAAAAGHPVVGIAGVTRALGPSAITAAIEPAFRRLAGLDPDVIQYKVCSTADSSPAVGSFAPAIRLGREITGQHPVPVVVAQPNLGRYTVFSNHFAVDRGTVYRLDRQPVMSRHPVTPMREADLRRHLELQLEEPVGAVTVNDLRAPDRGAACLAAAREHGLAAVVVDALTDQDLERAGRMLLDSAEGGPAFAVGSGGLATGIAAALGRHQKPESSPVTPVQGPCLAVSGSCSPSTGDQIRHAVAHGWHGVRLDLSSGAAPSSDNLDEVTEKAHRALAAGRSVVIYTCGDGEQVSRPLVDVNTVASALASVVHACRERVDLPRVVVAGGDTSGHVVTALGATAMKSKSVIGDTLLCELEATSPTIHGLEVVLKGGQIGAIDFFERVRLGDGASSSMT